MKKLMYLFVAGTMFAFTACGGGETATEEAASDVVPAADVVAAEEQAASDTSAAEEVEDTEEATEETSE